VNSGTSPSLRLRLSAALRDVAVQPCDLEISASPDALLPFPKPGRHSRSQNCPSPATPTAFSPNTAAHTESRSPQGIAKVSSPSNPAGKNSFANPFPDSPSEEKDSLGVERQG
jgi:hypothetical protein